MNRTEVMGRMQVITTLLGHSIREIIDPRKYAPDADSRQQSNFETGTRFKCCECLLVERDARFYPCCECADNMAMRVESAESHFIPRDLDGEEGVLETVLFEDDE